MTTESTLSAKRLHPGVYEMSDGRFIVRLEFRQVVTWALYDSDRLTKSVWLDDTVRRFDTLTAAKAYAGRNPR